MKRLFVSIELPHAIRALLASLDPQVRGVRWTSAEQMHLTIAFFGATSEEAEIALRERLAQIEWKAFHLPLVGVGTFPRSGAPKVVWVGVGSGHPHLFQLHKRVQEAALAAGIEPDLRAFHPHVTTARCRDVSLQTLRPFLRANAEFDAGMIHVAECHLMSSKLTPAGSVHTRELTVPSS